MDGYEVLPYRTDGDDLARLIEARARGRELKHIQGLNFSTSGFQGTVTAATTLGFLDPDSDKLTDLGRTFAMSRDVSDRRQIMLEAMLAYPPYELLLARLLDHSDESETPTDEIELWWGSTGYGNSPRNRSDGSTVFAKLVEYVGLGQFLIGRRGRPSRIEWASDARKKFRAVQDSEGELAQQVDRTEERSEVSSPVFGPLFGHSEGQTDSDPEPKEDTIAVGNSELRLPLGAGRTAYLSVPASVTQREKDRLIKLIDLMINVEDEDVEDKNTEV